VPAYLEAMPQDAFSDGALRYVVTDTGALVYSIATDGKDNDGLSMDDAAGEDPSVPNEGWDLPFRLLNPELRGATQSIFRDEVMGSSIDLSTLADLGLDEEKLRELGLSEDDVDSIRYR